MPPPCAVVIRRWLLIEWGASWEMPPARPVEFQVAWFSFDSPQRDTPRHKAVASSLMVVVVL